MGSLSTFNFSSLGKAKNRWACFWTRSSSSCGMPWFTAWKKPQSRHAALTWATTGFLAAGSLDLRHVKSIVGISISVKSSCRMEGRCSAGQTYADGTATLFCSRVFIDSVAVEVGLPLTLLGGSEPRQSGKGDEVGVPAGVNGDGDAFWATE